MEDNIRDRLEVKKENLIPIDPLEKCLWAMEATGKIANFGLITMTQDNEEQIYGKFYWVINHQLGDLEYKLRTGEIDKEQFEAKCNEVYDKYDVNFDILRDNFADLKSIEQESTQEKTDKLSNKLNAQTKEFINRQQNKMEMKQETKKDNNKDGFEK